MHRTIANTDVLAGLRALPPDSIDTVVTSPPYWALRDYEESDQWGMERHPSLYLQRLAKLMAGLRRVVKPTGSVWINLGDAYAESGKGASQFKDSGAKESWHPAKRPSFDYGTIRPRSRCLIPERFAVNAVDAGWILRNDVIWHKSSSLPSSVRNRLTNKYEHIYFFTKEPSGYFFDLEAIRVPSKTFTRPPTFDRRPVDPGVQATLDGAPGSQPEHTRKSTKIDTQLVRAHSGNVSPEGVQLNHPGGKNPGDLQTFDHKCSSPEAGTAARDIHQRQEANGMKATDFNHPGGKNPGDVQDFVREQFPEAHFAVFPPALVEWILSCSCPPRVCGSCGAPHMPIVVPSSEYREHLANQRRAAELSGGSTKMRREADKKGAAHGRIKYRKDLTADYIHKGYRRSCLCESTTTPLTPGIVLDPFMGAGTTALAAERQNRRWTGIELSESYIDIARRRLEPHQNESLER